MGLRAGTCGDDDDRWLVTMGKMRRSSLREKVLSGVHGRFCGSLQDVRVLKWEWWGGLHQVRACLQQKYRIVSPRRMDMTSGAAEGHSRASRMGGVSTLALLL